jgi:GTPase SAR1 family protein
MEGKMMRLSQVARKLDVSIVTVTEVLRSRGHVVDNNPNAKLAIDQLEILAKEFNTPELLDENSYLSELNLKSSEIDKERIYNVDKMMRLSQAARKLNVSIVTITEILSSHGLTVQNNPNTKLSFAEISVLAKELNSPDILSFFEEKISLPKVNEEEILYYREEPFELNTNEKIQSFQEKSVRGKVDLNPSKIDPVEDKIKKLSNNPTLDLSNQNLFRIPVNLKSLTKLKKLILNNNQIIKIENLPPNIIELELNNNEIEVIENLPPKLQYLKIRNNKIKTITNLPKTLFSVDLSNNLINSSEGLPTSLKLVKLSGNKLTNFNFTKNLISVILSNNLIEKLPIFTESEKLQELVLFNNPIKDLNTAILGTTENSNCLKGLKNYLEEFKRKKIKNTKIKLLFIGNSNVGKSNLVAALQGKETGNLPSTHGACLYTYKIEDIDFQIWDLGGQEIYLGTHRIFLMAEGVQVLVYDLETESQSLSPDRLNPEEPVRNIMKEYYYEKIKELSFSSRIITVENKIDIQRSNSSFGYPHIKTSVNQNIGIQALKTQIWEEGKQLNLYGLEVPYFWNKVGEAIQKLSSSTKVISKESFYQICKENEVLEDGIESLLEFLHNTGVLFYKPELENEIIIDLIWALQVIYKVFDRQSSFYKEMRDNQAGYSSIRTFFNDFDQTDLNLKIEEKWLFYKFLKSSGLCFPLESEEFLDTYIVFPEFLSNKKPEVVALWQLKMGNKVKIQKKYNFLPYYPLHNFIARFGKKSQLNKFWRNGILIYAEKNDYSGFLIEADFQNHSITIEIDESVIEWQQAIIDCIEDLDENNQGNWGVAAENTSSKQKEELDNLQNILFLESNKLQSNVEKKRIVISYAKEDIKELEKLEIYLKANNFNFWVDKKMSGTQNWNKEIEHEFENADGYLILLSAEYMNPDKNYIHEKEIPLILCGLEKGKYCQILNVKTFTLNESHSISKINAFNKGETMPSLDKDSEVCEFLDRFIRNELLKKF